jgi:hypothetical protein
MGRNTEELLPVSGDSFRLESEPVATLFLVRDAWGETYLQSGHEGHLRKTSGYSAWGKILGLIATQLLMISALIFAPVWLVTRQFRRMKSTSARVVLPLFAASLSLYGGFLVAALTLTDVQMLLEMSLTSLSLYFGTTLFGLMCIAVAIDLFRPLPSNTRPLVQTWSRLTTIACLVHGYFLEGRHHRADAVVILIKVYERHFRCGHNRSG